MAQDSGFSFPQQRFETAWGYKKTNRKVGLLFLFSPQAVSLAVTARLNPNKYKEDSRKRVLFCTPMVGLVHKVARLNPNK